jgi:hypothetical protein
VSQARILVALAYRLESSEEKERMFAEVGSLVDRTDDPAAFVEILGYQANHELIQGRVRRAEALIDRATAIAAQGRPVRRDYLFFETGLLTFVLGDLARLDASTTDYERAVASAGPHVQQHPRRGRALAAFARGDWPAGRAIAHQVAQSMDEHPETVFCFAAGNAVGFGASAAAISGELVEARELLARATKLSALPSVGEVWLAAAYAALGQRGDVLRIDDKTPADAWAQWLPVALTEIGEWDRVTRRLPMLERRAAGGDRFCGGVAAAIREELAARNGGPRPSHAALREIGYAGISAMLSFRPKVG